ncbi:MAG: single-stranded DNA-binding protein [Planctomycetota bacterium]|nr:single-stranded DNA-binding protein [Planctomycetota bacterium]
MASLNKVFLMGNLTRDPELRFIDSGTPVAEFGMAINRNWKDSSGASKEEVCFVDVTCWGRRAEVANEYLRKGRPVFVEGRLKFDSWEAKDGGGKRSKLRVVADNFQFLGGRPGADQNSAETPVPAAAPKEAMGLGDDEIPF